MQFLYYKGCSLIRLCRMFLYHFVSVRTKRQPYPRIIGLGSHIQVSGMLLSPSAALLGCYLHRARNRHIHTSVCNHLLRVANCAVPPQKLTAKGDTNSKEVALTLAPVAWLLSTS